jgi:uncharacterized RDD family membrane protein YckC
MHEPHDPYQAPASAVDDVAPEPVALRVAGRWRRLGTYVVDAFGFAIVGILVAIVMVVAVGEAQMLAMLEGWRENVFSLGIMIAYYLFFEGLFGRTPGKFACGTRVVDESGARPRFGQVVGRTFARLIPFEPLSLLFNAGRTGWHDTLPHTLVVLVPGRG